MNRRIGMMALLTLMLSVIMVTAGSWMWRHL